MNPYKFNFSFIKNFAFIFSKLLSNFKLQISILTFEKNTPTIKNNIKIKKTNTIKIPLYDISFFILLFSIQFILHFLKNLSYLFSLFLDS